MSHAATLTSREPGQALLPRLLRMTAAAAIALGAVAYSCAIMVPAGEAVVVTSFGAPVRVLTSPGLAWKWPAPVEATIPVDLRLHTTSGGLADVGTREGLRILVQAYVAWSLPDDPVRIRQFLRAGGNDPDEVARQLRSLLGSALQVTAANFALPDLVNTESQRLRLDDFEHALADTMRRQAMDMYGVRIGEVGLERLSLPAETLAATVARMRTERETVAAERTAEGLRQAAAIRSDAGRDARILAARAHEEAASIEADAQEKAASIYSAAYARDPQLYAVLRSLDTLATVVGPRTRLVLRSDSAPFNVLADGPAATVLPPPLATSPAPADSSEMAARPVPQNTGRPQNTSRAEARAGR